MDNEKFGILMYHLTKTAARNSFVDYLENIDIAYSDYESIKNHLENTYGIKLYL